MNTTMNKRIHDALLVLSSLQEPDGSFLSTTIPTAKTVHTTYYTSLILLCIEHAPAGPEKELIVSRSIAYLKSCVSEQCTWNYLADRSASPYPDDLDDTFLALLAIAVHNPEWFTPEIMVAVTNLLIACETQLGGPYYTWVVPADRRNEWNDVDIVANANIAAFLGRMNIDVPPLKQWLAFRINKRDLSSAFYHDKKIVQYFLSRSDTVKHAAMITELLQQERQVIPWFIERITGGQPMYSTCIALTTALMIEHLCPTLPPDMHSGSSLDQEYLSRLYEKIRNDLSSTPLLCERILCEFKKLNASDPSGMIRLLPLFFYQNMSTDLRDAIPESVIIDLCAAGISGWIGFTMQDDVIDGHGNIKDLPVASSCIMRAQELFSECASSEEMVNIISEILQGINESLMHETTSSNISLNMIGKKSLGYALGPVILTYLAESSPDFVSETTLSTGVERGPTTEIERQAEIVMKFFENFLIVRQSLDDLHDWYDDLSNGVMTPVVTTVLDTWKQANGKDQRPTDDDRDDLQRIFWDTVLDRMADQIRTHIIRAEDVLGRIAVLENTSFLQRMLDRYVAALDRAVAERNKTQAFIDAYAEK